MQKKIRLILVYSEENTRNKLTLTSSCFVVILSNGSLSIAKNAM